MGTALALGLVGRRARTGAAPLVPGQLEPRTALTGHAPFGRLLADVGAAVLFIHTVEALWDTEKRARGKHNETPPAATSGREAGDAQRIQTHGEPSARRLVLAPIAYRSETSTATETFLCAVSRGGVKKKKQQTKQMQKWTNCKNKPCLRPVETTQRTKPASCEMG